MVGTGIGTAFQNAALVAPEALALQSSIAGGRDVQRGQLNALRESIGLETEEPNLFGPGTAGAINSLIEGLRGSSRPPKRTGPNPLIFDPSAFPGPIARPVGSGSRVPGALNFSGGEFDDPSLIANPFRP
jgi:hypothetical protein